MENNKHLARIYELENEIASIKKQLEKPKKKTLYDGPVKFFIFLRSWGLISSFIAVLILIIVKFAYNINFFDKYENSANTQEISDYYLHLGEKLMENLQWESAEEAFLQSLKIKDNNIKANTRLAMVQVFSPEKGQTYFDPNISSIKLHQLKSKNEEDYMYHFLKGYLYEISNDEKNAKTAYTKSQELIKNEHSGFSWNNFFGSNNEDRKFIGGYLQIGNIFMRSNLDSALAYYNKAYQIDTSNNLVLGNIGACYFTMGKFEAAIPYLDMAYYSQPTYSSALILGEAYKFNGNFELSMAYDQWAWDLLNEKNGKDITVRSTTFWNFMQEKDNDSSVFKTVYATDSIGKIILAGFALSYDQALRQNFKDADSLFRKLSSCKGINHFSDFLSNRISSILYYLKPEGEVKNWFVEKKQRLLSSRNN